MMNNYWSNRAVELEKLLQDKTNATIVEINKLYSDASKSIASKIAKIFETYKKSGQIDSAHALQLLTAHQTAEQRKELLELLSRTTDKKARREIISILDAPAYADRISRLQALQDLVKAEALQLGIAEEKLTTARLKDVAKASYYRTIYNDQKNIGKAYDFNKISSRQLKAMLAHKWSGSNYSARIWNNNDKFIDKLQRTIEVGCMAGLTLRELEDRIVDDCIGETSDEGQRFCASRLIRTEVNYFANQGMLMGYEEAGIKKYLFVATLDLKTSEICRKLDLKSFQVSEAETGVNLPPMHPFCRSVTIPDTGSRSGTRWARNPITGKSMKVPADMTYEQWYDKYVKKTVENNADNVIIKNTVGKEVKDVHYIGKLDKSIYQCVTDDITTDEVIITDERISHIKSHHPGHFEIIEPFLQTAIASPDYILEDSNNSGLVLKQITENDLRVQIVLRLHTSADPAGFKNSLISAWKISESRWNNYINNKKILYKSE